MLTTGQPGPVTREGAAPPETTAPLNWGKHDPEESARIHRRDATLIAKALHETEGRPEVEVLLALGTACPHTAKADRAIWVEEINWQRNLTHTARAIARALAQKTT